MGWAARHIEALQHGNPVKFRPVGNSMAGRIESGQLVTVVPIGPEPIKVDDVVLCRIWGREFLHLVKGIRGSASGKEYMIGNNKGFVNGWIKVSAIFGKLEAVED